MSLLYHAYVYLEFLILACTIYILAPGSLCRAACGEIWEGYENSLMAHIRHIREKIEINPKEPRYLKVVWGVGYKI